MQIIYSLHGKLNTSNSKDLRAAIQYLNEMEDFGYGVAVGVYNQATGIVYVPEVAGMGGDVEAYLFDKNLDALESMGIRPSGINFYNVVRAEGQRLSLDIGNRSSGAIH